MIQRILTVCVGNICRSPMAEALFAQSLPSSTVCSAGIGALTNHSADSIARELMLERGLDISNHRARQLNAQMTVQNDIILVMEIDQKAFIETAFPATRGKVYRLCHFQEVDIPDPYKQDRLAFEFSLTLIEKGVKEWSSRIAKI